MQQARYSFNPCWYGVLIYLCGGRNSSIEVFDPRNYSFTLIDDITLPKDFVVWDSITLLDEDTLVILSRNYIYRWNVSSRKRILSQQHPWYGVYSHCTPITRAGLGFLVDIKENGEASVCLGLNLASGAVEIEETLRN
jgi:hypothetical protein